MMATSVAAGAIVWVYLLLLQRFFGDYSDVSLVVGQPNLHQAASQFNTEVLLLIMTAGLVG